MLSSSDIFEILKAASPSIEASPTVNVAIQLFPEGFETLADSLAINTVGAFVVSSESKLKVITSPTLANATLVLLVDIVTFEITGEVLSFIVIVNSLSKVKIPLSVVLTRIE